MQMYLNTNIKERLFPILFHFRDTLFKVKESKRYIKSLRHLAYCHCHIVSIQRIQYSNYITYDYDEDIP